MSVASAIERAYRVSSNDPSVSPVPLTEVYWKDALDSAGQGVWDYDLATDKATYSETWYKMRGLLPGNVGRGTDSEWLLHIHPDDLEKARDTHSKLNTGQMTEISFEYRERHVNGHWIWIMCRGKAISWDDEGKPCRLIGTDTDITKFKASEFHNKMVSKRLELALSSVEIGIWQYDIMREKVEWDSRLRAIYGLPENDMQLPRDAWETAIHPDDFERAMAVTQSGLHNRLDYNLDYRIIRVDGETAYIRSRVSYQEDPINGPMLIGVNWDVTNEHKRSADLEAANYLANTRNAEIESARAQMEYNSHHDSLTGLPNRRKLDLVQQESINLTTGEHARFAILHIDLDRFKQINDAFGHEAGDFVLRRTAEILISCAGSEFLVARVGGDEFVIFVPNAPSDVELSRFAKQLISRISKSFLYRGCECRYGASIGIAVAEGLDIDGKALFVNADMALYQAKNEGRGRVCFFTATMKSAAIAHKHKCDEIMSGLERDEFFCVYQPQFNAKSLLVSGVEALVRWKHPKLGILLPNEFLSTVEEMNALAKIDEIALQKSVADFHYWTAQGLNIPRISINVSKATLHDPEFPNRLAGIDIDLTKISLELLEANFFDDLSEVVSANILAIRGLGIEIEVDDFGTGFTSVVGLLRLRPNRLKIDKALIAPIAGSDLQSQLLTSIIRIGHLQGISITAEGVETDEQLHILRSIGCDELQGYALAQPMQPSELTAFLNAFPNPQFSRMSSNVTSCSCDTTTAAQL